MECLCSDFDSVLMQKKEKASANTSEQAKACERDEKKKSSVEKKVGRCVEVKDFLSFVGELIHVLQSEQSE